MDDNIFILSYISIYICMYWNDPLCSVGAGVKLLKKTKTLT